MKPTLPRRDFLKYIGSGAAALSLGCNIRSGVTDPRPAHPNFIIILADDMGYGDSSCYGGWIETPNLNRLADEGLRFTDFHSSGTVCSPTRAGLLTGRYQERAGIPGVINADPEHASHGWGLDPAEITFPQLLKLEGYTSAIFGKWHLGYTRSFNPLNHGFDRFCGYVSGNIDYLYHYDRMGNHDWWNGLDLVEEEGYTTHLINRHAVEFIRENRERPFCLYISHEAVHTPLQAPGDPPQRGPGKQRAYGNGGETEQDNRDETGNDAQVEPIGQDTAARDSRDKKQTYRRMMEEMDRGIGEITAALREAGIADRTLVFFFSDNGATGQGSNAPLRGKKGTVWEGGHRVPAVAWWPGRIRPGTTSDALAASLDLMPTMLGIAGAAAPPGHRFDGVSLEPVLLQGRRLGRRRLFWNGKAMRDNEWKLVIGKSGPQLFDLSQDIGETADLAAEYPERVKEMVTALQMWQNDVTRD